MFSSYALPIEKKMYSLRALRALRAIYFQTETLPNINLIELPAWNHVFLLLLMQSNQDSIYFVAAIGAILGLLFVVFIISMLYVYQQRKLKFVQEIERLKQQYSKTLLETRVEIQEETMNQISRELHDDLSTVLSLINIHLVIIQPEKIEETKEKVNQIREFNMYVLNKMRSYSHLLSSDLIEHRGFAKVFHLMLENLPKNKELKLKVDITGEEFRFGAGRETIVFRICQEVINNILKHARAKIIKVKIEYLYDALDIDIQDDGVGFELDESGNEVNGTGWLNIKSRAKMINALVNIQSQKGEGTKFNIRVPLSVLNAAEYDG